jgi:hypothetical protein
MQGDDLGQGVQAAGPLRRERVDHVRDAQDDCCESNGGRDAAEQPTAAGGPGALLAVVGAAGQQVAGAHVVISSTVRQVHEDPLSEWWFRPLGPGTPVLTGSRTGGGNPMRDPRGVATTYFESWNARDFDTLRSILADDVTFRGPLGEANNADECIAGLRKLSESVTEVAVLKMADDRNDVLTWFDLYTEGLPPTATVNWQHIEDGRIARIRVTFDPRAMLAKADAA